VHLFSTDSTRLASTSISFQAGLFSAFVVPKIQDLKASSADQSAYYQNQTVYLLDRISQQFASVDRQISSNHTPPLPYAFHPSASDRRVNIFWLISLVCSLSTALLTTLVQQWARANMRIFQQSRNRLKTARIRLFLFEDARRLPSVVEFVPQLITILVCICPYLYRMVASIWNPQLPHWTLFSLFIWRLFQILRRNRLRAVNLRLIQPGVGARRLEKGRE
jgi:Family of unknown function (DUF6535)